MIIIINCNNNNNSFEFPLTVMGRDVVVPVLERGAPIFGGLYNNVKDLDQGKLLICIIK